MSLIERLKAAPTRRVEQVKGTSLGDDVYVRELTGREFDDAVRDLKGDSGEAFTLGRVELVAIALCDKDGNAAIDFCNPDDRALIGNLVNSTLMPIYKKAEEVNGFARPSVGED